MSKIIKNLLCLTLVATLLVGDFIAAPRAAYAGTVYGVVPDVSKPTPLNMINGSFERPNMATENVAGQRFPAGTSAYNWYLASEATSTVPGWRTVPMPWADTSDPYAYHIEFQYTQGKSNGASYTVVADSFAHVQADGTQYAELNCNL